VTGLASAIERREWQLAALYLLLGVSEAWARLPPESMLALVDLLACEEERPEEALRDG
jgi:hypothetical protein